jgi:hypothetical protein
VWAFLQAGGRVLVRLEDLEVDFSPSFTLMLTTRDNTCQFSPDLCSRATFVNFIVTPSSLQSQCLNKVLKVCRPQVDARRSGLLKLQGEFQVRGCLAVLFPCLTPVCGVSCPNVCLMCSLVVGLHALPLTVQARLRELEEKLLLELNSVTGNILENDAIILSLESIKREASEVAAEVSEGLSVVCCCSFGVERCRWTLSSVSLRAPCLFDLQIANTDAVMAEISLVSNQFAPFATTCSRTFFSVQQLPQLHFLYQVSLSSFLHLVDEVLGVLPAVGGPAAGAGAGSSVSGVGTSTVSLFGSADPSDAPEVPGLIKRVVQQVFAHVGPGLLHEHKLVLAMRLVQVSLAASDTAFDDHELELLLRGAGHAEPDPRHVATVQSVLGNDGYLSASQIKVWVTCASRLVCLGARCTLPFSENACLGAL